ncbi:MAG: pilus assembly PilX N-terminal domain-containing protein [Gemmatimonadetes bacterium]|nr:pilus assembly PilX N-terminal domain-containing protein [Gemmatimonadota bacterium]
MPRSLPPCTRDERGVALIMTLLLAFLVAAIAIGAIMMSGNNVLVSRYHAREAGLQSAADAGLEIGRDSLNRNPGMLPATGDTVLALNQPVRDAQNQIIPGYTRSIYAGRTGGRTGGLGSAGQYGLNLASVVSVISDPRGAVAARRLLLTQSSWSQFAVAVNSWTGGPVYGCWEQVQGPFHSNTQLRLQNGCSGANRVLFTGPVTVAGSIVNPNSGNFQQGTVVPAQAIPWPSAAQFALMRSFAQQSDAVNGDYDITPSMGGANTRTPSVRIEFVPIDRNGNGTFDWDEGYMRVWQATNTGVVATDTVNRNYVGARRAGTRPVTVSTPGGWANFDATLNPNVFSSNCGVVRTAGGVPRFRTARSLFKMVDDTAAYAMGPNDAADSVQRAFNGTRYAGKACYLGGDPRLFGTGNAALDTLTPTPAFMAANSPVGTPVFGQWITKRLAPTGSIVAKRPGDNSYLIPLGNNPNFKGVVYVNGSVVVSGRLRGRVSIVSTGTIMLADDITYVTTPGTQCNDQGDILGLLSADSVLIADNSIQRPWRVEDKNGANATWQGLFDDTPSSENYHAFIFALKDWGGENYSPGWTEGFIAGENAPSASGGFVRVTGGLIQGFVRVATYNGNAGWQEAHVYDVCGSSAPPPYFPTTGRYSKSRYYELDPVWLNTMPMDTLFVRLQAQ